MASSRSKAKERWCGIIHINSVRCAYTHRPVSESRATRPRCTWSCWTGSRDRGTFIHTKYVHHTHTFIQLRSPACAWLCALSTYEVAANEASAPVKNVPQQPVENRLRSALEAPNNTQSQFKSVFYLFRRFCFVRMFKITEGLMVNDI